MNAFENALVYVEGVGDKKCDLLFDEYIEEIGERLCSEAGKKKFVREITYL